MQISPFALHALFAQPAASTKYGKVHMVGVGNQHSSNTAEISTVKIKSEKTGQAYMKMRSTQRGRALWDTYKLGKPREKANCPLYNAGNV